MDVNNLQVRGTVVSLYPRDIPNQFKPDLVPDTYVIRAGDPVTKKAGITHINSCRRRQYVGEDRGGIQSIMVPASEVCEALVHDFINSCIYVTSTARPALFWVPDLLSSEEVAKKHADKVETAIQNQFRWFKLLVEKADETWSKIKNPRAVTDIQKYAASYLKLERDWVLDQEIARALMTCPLCTAKVSPAAIVCMNCKAVLKPKEYEEYQKRTGKVA